MAFTPVGEGEPRPANHHFSKGLIIFGGKRPKPSARPSTPGGQEKTPSESSEAEESSAADEQ